MPTTRRLIQRDPRPHVSAEVLALYARLRAIRNDPAHRAEFDAGSKRLCRELGLYFWSMKTPLTVTSVPPPATRSLQRQCWEAAWQWRQALDAALERQAHVN